MIILQGFLRAIARCPSVYKILAMRLSNCLCFSRHLARFGTCLGDIVNLCFLFDFCGTWEGLGETLIHLRTRLCGSLEALGETLIHVCGSLKALGETLINVCGLWEALGETLIYFFGSWEGLGETFNYFCGSWEGLGETLISFCYICLDR